MSDTTVLYTVDTTDLGTVRLTRWPEGLELWVGGRIKWKSRQDERDKLVELEHQLAEARERADNNGYAAKGWRSRWETDLPHALERAEAAEQQLAAVRAALEPFAGCDFWTEFNSCIEDDELMLDRIKHTSGFVDDQPWNCRVWKRRAEDAERRLAEAIGPAALERALEAWHRPLEWWARKGSDPLRNHRERMAEAIRAALVQIGSES